MFKPVAQKIDFPSIEKEVLDFWRTSGIFQKSLEQRRGGESFVFFEGPPTANGTPHNGHVLTRVIKDLLPRYKAMQGYYVPRKAGWDTHGLPVEVEVEKELGIHGKADIEAYGVEAFTRKCIASVFRYTDVWQELTERIGFWVDLDDAYVTFHQSYVESVWWALSELYKKGLLYQGHKVVWWWPQGGTALSSGEVGLGYKTVDDPSITVRFRMTGRENTSFLAWTTTPWTLPSNCALTIRESLTYAFAEKDGEIFVLAADLLDKVLGEGAYTVHEEVKGSDLLGESYEPLFDYGAPEGGKGFVVISGDFVTTSAGTGVVHTAPAFGEDDHRVAKKNGVGMLQLIEPDGTFSPAARDFAGRFCKEADRDIIRNLNGRGLLFKEETYRHDYPFCWRADNDPLIQYARPAWFIRTTDVIERTKANNQKIHWVPERIKDGRFGDFLNNNVDWALSRERYWGTPLNIWECASCEAGFAPSSTNEILERNPSAFDAFDAALSADPTLSEHLRVHKPWIDDVTVPCADCDATMHRVPEVIDCWFDSGCMPFAQWGWPHKGEERFKESWPADFISEAIDQTRGWFYSLLMISSLLFDDAEHPHPFRSCIALGHITDKKGHKESKSKGNYTPPDEILNTNGADAMRWYFYAANPPYNNTRHSPEAVRQSQQEFLIKLYNVYSFFVIYGNIDKFDPATTPRQDPGARSLMDRWILSELNLTVQEVTEHLDALRIYEAAQRIIKLTDAVSNWYVRRSRDRFWSSEQDAEKWDTYHTLYEVLTTISKLTAPFIPFFAEEMYRNLVPDQITGSPESVHLNDWPSADTDQIDEKLSEEMDAVREIVSMGLSTRGMHKLKVRQPLSTAELILARSELKDRLNPYLNLILEELNVKELLFSQDAEGRVSFTVKPNYRLLGPRFGKRMPMVRAALDACNPDEVRMALSTQGEYRLTLSDGDDVSLDSELVQVTVQAEEGFAASGGAVGTVILDTRLDDALISEGVAREITNRIQNLRKEEDLDYTARIRVHMDGAASILAACDTHREVIAAETLATTFEVGGPADFEGITIESKVGDEAVTIRMACIS